MKKPIPYGKYLLLERVNVGGMAEVFKAKVFGVEGFERLVAVKRILPAIAENEEFTTMFIDEAKIAVQLTHANIAQIFDLGRVGDSFFIAMEYVHGRDLRAIFDRCRRRGETIPIRMACYVTMKVCEGLDYAHNKRDNAGVALDVVHRDVSPQNVLLSNHGEVKLIDFGVAKASGRTGTTQSGILKGKFGYMSPEQVRGLPIDRRSDVFAVGVCLYEILTGERLFVGASDFSTLEKVRTVDIVPPSQHNPAIGEELERIVLRALAREADDRYPSAMDLHDDLQSYMYTSGSFFSRKDLSSFMHGLFSEEIARERTRDDAYQELEFPSSPPARFNESVAGSTADAHDRPTRAVVAAPGHRSAVSSVAVPPERTGVPPPLPPDAVTRTPSRTGSSMWPPPAARVAGAAALQVESVDERIATTTYERPEPDPASGAHPSYPSSPLPVGYESHLDPYAFGPRTTNQENGPPAFRMPYESPAAGYGPPAAPPPYAGPPAVGGPELPFASPRLPPMGSVPQPSGSERAGAPSPFSVVMPPPDVPEGPPSRVSRGKKEKSRAPSQRSRRRPRRRSRLGPILLGLGFTFLCLFGAAGGVYFFLAPAEPGVVIVTTTPADATLLFDEKAIDDPRSPYVIESVEPRMNHLLQVQRPGYRPYSQQVRVESGQTLELDEVRLEEVEGPLPLVGTGFTLSTDPAGARVYVDGGELPHRTPVQVTDLEPGRYTIRVEHGSRYAPWETEIGVGPDEIVQLPRVTLRLRSVTVQFRSDPPGAAVTLVRGGQRRAIGSTPTNADVALNGPGWRVEMTRRGFAPWSRELDPPGGRDEFEVRAELHADASPGTDNPSAPSDRLTRRPGRAPPATTVRHAPVLNSRPPSPPESQRRTPSVSDVAEAASARSEPADPPASTPAVPAPTPAPPAPNDVASAPARPALPSRPEPSPSAPEGVAETGTLQVNSVPWSQVYVDGELIGHTPQMNIELRPGRHRVRFVNPDFHVSHTVGVDIRAGESVRRIVRLPVGQ